MSARILVVDDAPDVLLATRRTLAAAGHDVVLCATVGEAETAWADHTPDLVLLDVNLPDANGIERCRAWKDDPDRADVPIVLRSAVSVSAAEQAVGLTSGADGYLTEPTEPEVLAATVSAFLRIRSLVSDVNDAADKAHTLLDYSVQLGQTTRPDDVIKLLDDAVSTALDAHEIRLRWHHTGSPPNEVHGNPLEAPNVLDDLLETPRGGAVFYRSAAELSDPRLVPDEQHSWAVLAYESADLRATLAVGCGTPQRFDTDQQDFFVTFMNLTAAALARTAALALHRSIADTLQRALLPDVDTHSSVQLQRQLVIADGATLAGGDWLDAYQLPNGTQLVLVGDVVGHGATAASQSAVFRHTLRSLLVTGHQVAKALVELDRIISNQRANPQGTLLVVEIDTTTGDAKIFSCGHPPPILVTNGTATVIEPTRASPLLGFGLLQTPPTPTSIELAGNHLVVFTDGVVERRSELIDDGYASLLDRLHEVDRPETALNAVETFVRRSPTNDDALFAVCSVNPSASPTPGHQPDGQPTDQTSTEG